MERIVKKVSPTTALTQQQDTPSTHVQPKGASALAQPIAGRMEFDDPEFLARLRRGEPRAYRLMIKHLHGSLIGLATSIIGSRAQAEEVVQDTWLAVFTGIGAFRGHANLSTWVFSIVLNRARTRATREARLTGLPGVGRSDADPHASGSNSDGRSVEPRRMWDEISPERIVAGRQVNEHIIEAIQRLPAGQRAVFILRDIEGCEAEDACALLGIVAGTQRLWLHRARSRIRQTIAEATGAPHADSP
jgi:RNA polymerase sigma factor (sigma-70 family)